MAFRKLFLLSEPRLAQHLNKIGITNSRSVRPVEHRGLRAPSVLDVRKGIDNLDIQLRPIFDVVRDQIAAAERGSERGLLT